MPFLRNWAEFKDYFGKMRSTGIVNSMKDFYWDIRPKPEFGTVEVRVFDTPLTVERAAALAIYTQGVAREILARSKLDVTEDAYLVYGFNRFQACRFGLQGEIVDPFTRERRPLMDDICATLDTIRAHARPDDDEALREIVRCLEEGNDAAWLRQRFAETASLGRVVGMQLEHFAGQS
jgi:carboxylate-amine ligase